MGRNSAISLRRRRLSSTPLSVNPEDFAGFRAGRRAGDSFPAEGGAFTLPLAVKDLKFRFEKGRKWSRCRGGVSRVSFRGSKSGNWHEELR